MVVITRVVKEVVKIGLLAIASAAVNEELRGSTKHVWHEAKRGYSHMKESRKNK